MRSTTESKLAAISALMSDFSTKVLEQAETIESVLDDTRRSTVHLDRGQQELRVRWFGLVILCARALSSV